MQCFWHPSVPATQVCERCQRWHCAACVRHLKAGRGELEVCGLPGCDGLLRVGAVVLEPWPDELRRLARLPFTREGVLTALAISIPIFVESLPLLGAIGGALEIIFLAALGGYYFLLVDHLGRGREGLPGPSDTMGEFGSMMRMLLRGVGCLFLGGLPLVAWRVHVGFHESPTLETHPFTILGLEALGHTYVPAIILAIVITEQESALFWPPLWFQIAARAPREYLQLVGWFLLSLLAWWLASMAGRFALGGIPLLGPWLAESVSTLFLLLQATLVGAFLHRHRSEFTDH